jgi:iron(III) transport system substrate-binding protein
MNILCCTKGLRNTVALCALAVIVSAAPVRAQLVVDGETIAEKELFEAAKKEGVLNIYGASTPGNQQVMSEDFTNLTGIKINFVRGTSRQILPRVLAEHSAGRLGADFVDFTDLTFILELVDKGILAVPHKVPSWDKLADVYKDPQGRWYTFMLLTQMIGVNSGIVKPEELPTSFADLLHPRWKDRIGMPTIDAGGSSFAAQAFLKENMPGDFWRALRAQNPRIYPSVAPTVTNLVRGEISVAITGTTSVIQQLSMGAPLKAIFPKEGVPSFPQSGGIPATAKNPNAAKLYLNYVVSLRAGQIIATTGNYGAHADAPPPKAPGVEFPPQSALWSISAEQWVKIRDSYSKEWREIFGTK